ncbi:STAS domain-containing protein [Streptomyces sp. NPDC051577]|uniref:STAS domain-containing protein n=1 Tax=Streptomyces sp. NPDC051577 TaxID=3155166 RepID=UPI0034354B78
MATTGVRHYSSSVLVRIGGDLDEEAGVALRQVLDDVDVYARDLMVDLHEVASMDASGLLHLLDLHRRAECLGLRVLVTGWQPRPQQFMAQLVGIPGRGSSTGERYAVAGFRRLIEQRARRARDVGIGAGSLSHA